MATPDVAPGNPSRSVGPAVAVAVPVLAGLAASLVLGLYAGLHHPKPVRALLPGFSGPLPFKAWLSTVALVLAMVQVVTAAGVLGRFGPAPWAGPVHRWSGRLAVLVLLPVIAHCLYGMGFGLDSPRVLIHSLAGCLVFGAFAAKMLVLPRRDAPGWALPLFGGLLTVFVVVSWLTSALWFFRTAGFVL